jgi:hypothetical protein
LDPSDNSRNGKYAEPINSNTLIPEEKEKLNMDARDWENSF